MISDSPYDNGELALSPLVGLVGGLLGSSLMLVVVIVMQSITTIGVTDIVNTTGSIWAGNDLESVALFNIGLIAHFTTGGVLGLLYALCEQRGTRGGLLFVGIFYGFILWIMGTVIILPILDENARAVLRTWPYFIACLIYGLTLAAIAIWVDKRKPAGAVVPKD
jgi:hypothetical protein